MGINLARLALLAVFIRVIQVFGLIGLFIRLFISIARHRLSSRLVATNKPNSLKTAGSN